MKTTYRLACVGFCGRHVDPMRDGAYCLHCRPVDLTGGVAPHDVVAKRLPEWKPDMRGKAIQRGRPRVYSDDVLNEWAEQYAAGASSKDIANRYGVNSATVCYHLGRRGVVMRGWTGRAAGAGGAAPA